MRRISWYVRVLGVGLPLVGTSVLAQAQVAPSPPTPAPTLNDIPKKLSYSQIALGEVVLTPTAEVRNRYEYRHDFTPYQPALTGGLGRARSFDYLRTRFGLGADFLWAGAYVEAMDLREFNNYPDGSGVAKTQDAAMDLHQAYAEIKQPMDIPLSLRVGRQEMFLGSRYLVEAPGWNNKLRAFDMVRLTSQGKKYQADAFVGRVVDVVSGFDKGWKKKQTFSGVFANVKFCDAFKLDGYFLDLYEKSDLDPKKLIKGEDTAEGLGAIGDHHRMTVGTRLFGSLLDKSLEYETEFAYQFGKRASDKIRAYGSHSFVSYKLPIPVPTKIRAAHAYASGDQNNKDGKLQTFNPLFGTSHAPFGQIDFFRWQNVNTLRGAVTVNPIANLEILAEYNAFWLPSIHDKWVNSAGEQVGSTVAVGKDKSAFAGHELDLKVGYAVTKQVKLESGYAHFTAGSFLDGTTAQDKPADWFYLQLTAGL